MFLLLGNNLSKILFEDFPGRFFTKGKIVIFIKGVRIAIHQLENTGPDVLSALLTLRWI